MKKMMLVVASAIVLTSCAAQNQGDAIESGSLTTPTPTTTTTQRWQDVENPKAICEALSPYNVLEDHNKVIEQVLATRPEDALKIESFGSYYNLTGYKSKVYTFDSPNDFYEAVCMNEEEDFIFIIHNTGKYGVSFHSFSNNGGKFIGLTENYALFKEADGSITAVNSDIERTHTSKKFTDLSTEERETAIYPTGSYICDFDAYAKSVL